MHEDRRLYFAYGSNMDSKQMAERCPKAEPAGIALLPGHRFQIIHRGVATVVEDPNETVYGRLWWICADDETELDRREGVKLDLYRREYMEVQPIDGDTPLRALLYVSTNSSVGKPRPGYLELIYAAATASGFPEAYLDGLKPSQPPVGHNTVSTAEP